MSENVRVLANAESITSNQSSQEHEDNFLIVTPEKYRKLLEENRQQARKIRELQEEILLIYKHDIIHIPPKMIIT